MAPARKRTAGAMPKVAAKVKEEKEPGSQKVKKAKPGSFQGLGLSPPVFKAIMRSPGCRSQPPLPLNLWSCLEHL